MKKINLLFWFCLFMSFSLSSSLNAQCWDSTDAFVIPSTIVDNNNDGVPDDGTLIEVCYVVNGWNAGPNNDWFHGVQVDLPPSGFDATTVMSTQVPPQEQADLYELGIFGGTDYDAIATYQWLYENPDMASLGNAGTANQDFGWYVDEDIDRNCGGIINGDCISECGEENDEFLNTNDPFDGNPHNNFGLPSSDPATMWACGDDNPPLVYRHRGPIPTSWTFCFKVELDCGGDCGTNVPGDIVFYSQGDGTTGSWDNPDCTDPGTPVSFDVLLAGCEATIDATASDVAYCFGTTPSTIGVDAGITINSFDAGLNATANAGVAFVEICGAWDSATYPNPLDDPNGTGFSVTDAYNYFPGQADGTDGEGTNCDFLTLVPFTYIDLAADGSFIYDANCFAVGTPFVIDYRPEITASGTYDCAAEEIVITVGGGAPTDTNNPVAGEYTISGDLSGTTVGNEIIFMNLAQGDYSIDVTDASGCAQTFNISVQSCCMVAGGELSTTDPTDICIDGTPDPINVTLAGEMGTDQTWVITDANGNILALPAGSPFDLDGAGAGVCLIWSLSSDGPLTGATIGANANDIQGCFALSNPITVNRTDVEGGVITTTDPTEICVDGTADPINVTLAGNSATNQAWVITDDAGNILALPAGPPFDLDGAGAGVCLIWSLSFEDGLVGAEVGANANDLEGCYELSNPIAVTRTTLSLSATTTDVTCPSGNNGAIDLTVVGDGTYTYSWNNGLDTEDISGLSAGDYTVVVSDGICTETLTVTINDGNDIEEPVLTCPDDFVVALGGGECEGVVTFNVSASDNCDTGILPVQTAGISSGDVVAPGVYPITFEATDAAGNVATCSFTVTVEAFVPVSDALACNDLVNVSLDANCEAVITPDMLLEGQYKCEDLYEVNVYEGDQTETPIPGSPAISSDYVDATLTVTITDIETGLMCWGEIILEDKTTPEITVEEISYPCYVDPTPAYPGDYPEAFVSCCELTADNFSYVDLPGSNDECGGTFLRRWTVVGCNGINTNTADQLVTITIPTITDVEFPADVTLECGDAYLPANLDGIINEGSFDEDFPTVDGLDIDETLCNLGATYSDDIIPICEGSFKVIRTWTVIDWCTSEVSIEDQIIKVVDTIAPSISCPDNVTISTDVNVCTGQLILPAPSVTDICSATSYEVAVDDGVLTQGNNGAYLLSDLALGVYTVTYTASDACGNESDCSITIEVVDNVPPIAVCDEHTDVSLGGNGEILVNAETFDDGSHDNCSAVSFLVRRMDNPACPGNDATPFNETVPFTCCDVNTTIMVELLVTDEAGNTNTCMVEVYVEDKLGPHITCPPDVTISCKYEYDLEDLGASFGTVQTDEDEIQDVITNDSEGPYGNENWGQDGLAVDNCDVTVSETYSYNEECGNGLIIRTFTATDPQGLIASCTQRITITNFEPFDQNDISWPQDKDADCSQGIDITTTGQPGINDDHCDNVFVGHEDLVLEVSPPHCFKVIRTWIVIDWCQYDPDAPNAGGRWEHEQIIKVTDTEAPEFTSCQSPDIGCSYDEDCGPGYIELTAEATDNCTDVSYNYTIDAFNDGNVDISGNGNDASGDYPIGLHSITFYATDDCGNVSECSYTFEIIDCKQPTPICKVLASSIMPSAGMLTIWATDFEAGSSFDNCTDYEDLDFRIRKTTADIPQSNSAPVETSVTFDCTEIGTQWVELWVGDETGNWDYCTTYIVIQDPTGTCNNNEPSVLISGRITSESDEEVADVAVSLSGTNGFEPFVTGLDGAFAFDNLTMNENYTLTPIKDNDYKNGISTFDVVLMTKHILGIETLSTPYKLIAADINKSGSVTTADLVALRKLILNIDTEFQSNTSWRFVDKTFVFDDPTNPFASNFPEVISINDLDGNIDNADFKAIKIGDVNDSAIPNSAIGTQARTTIGSLVFNVEEVSLKAGETYTIDFDANQDILGYQFTLNFNQEALQFVDIAKGNAENFGLTLLDEGVVTTSWDNKVANASFSLRFKATTDALLSEVLSINSRFTAAEAYTLDADLLDVNLAFNTENGTVTSSPFELYQNTPNPFKVQTVVGFNLPEASTATLTIFDVSGKVLKQYAGNFAKGYNQFTLNKSEIAGAGVLYYQLDTDNDTDTKKMILID